MNKLILPEQMTLLEVCRITKTEHNEAMTPEMIQKRDVILKDFVALHGILYDYSMVKADLYENTNNQNWSTKMNKLVKEYKLTLIGIDNAIDDLVDADSNYERQEDTYFMLVDILYDQLKDCSEKAKRLNFEHYTRYGKFIDG